MVRQLTPQSSLENLKREAKRWLRALRDTDPAVQRDARARLERAVPNAPAISTLRDVQLALAREYGSPGWSALTARLAPHATSDEERQGRVAWFIQNACPDHGVRGRPQHVRALYTARRLLARYPEIVHDSFYTAIVCGKIEQVAATLAERPGAATEKGGPKGWEPILYLCFTRLDVGGVAEHAVSIARLLLDHGADPNVSFAAGGSAYTPLVGVIGEGEENRPPHPRRDELARLLLERGANPYDTQVIYNTGFHAQMLWYLEMIYEHTVRLGRAADWADPNWSMLDMGGYGSGARWMLDRAVRDNNLALAEWVLTHGASPNVPPARSKFMAQRSLYDEAMHNGLVEMATLFVRYGATPSRQPVDDVDAFTAATLRLDAAEARRLAARHPEYLQSADAMFIAARMDRVDVVRLLLDLGMSVDVSDKDGKRALHEAAYRNALRVAALLIERGAAIDPYYAPWTSTPIGAATYAQHGAMVELLGRVSRDVWELVYAGQVERLRELFREDPKLARITSDGHTPLMWLPPDDEDRALDVATLLLEYGADPTVVNEAGQTAADRAAMLGMSHLAEFLTR